MSRYPRKRGDTMPEVIRLSNGDAALDLTAASSVRLLIRAEGAASPKVNTVITPDTPLTLGQITWNPIPADVDTVGRFLGEIEIVWNTGKVQTIPDRGYDEWVFEADLGGTA